MFVEVAFAWNIFCFYTLLINSFWIRIYLRYNKVIITHSIHFVCVLMYCVMFHNWFRFSIRNFPTRKLFNVFKKKETKIMFGRNEANDKRERKISIKCEIILSIMIYQSSSVAGGWDVIIFATLPTDISW